MASNQGRESLGVSSLRGRFEPLKPKPPPPTRERVRSALDGPRQAVEVNALEAQRRSNSILKGQVKSQVKKRDVPASKTNDSDEVRSLKTAILSKEEEIQKMAAKLNEISQRLDRLMSMLYGGTVPAHTAKTTPLATSAGKSQSGPAKAPTPKYSKLLSQMK